MIEIVQTNVAATITRNMLVSQHKRANLSSNSVKTVDRKLNKAINRILVDDLLAELLIGREEHPAI